MKGRSVYGVIFFCASGQLLDKRDMYESTVLSVFRGGFCFFMKGRRGEVGCSRSHDDPQGQDVLDHGLSSAQGTLGLLPYPIAYTLPAEDVTALGGGRVLELFETQCTFALLAAPDVAHEVGVAEVKPGLCADGGMRRRGQVDPALLWPSMRARFREEEMVVVVGGGGVGVGV